VKNGDFDIFEPIGACGGELDAKTLLKTDFHSSFDKYLMNFNRT